uniref:C2H2-type domain-containing protein n=1 Tax=Timema poppense TaxID=170557 RepID=A0A7R9D274_TIMPO|nr:unnamed protein product [Timema poppensis]
METKYCRKEISKIRKEKVSRHVNEGLNDKHHFQLMNHSECQQTHFRSTNACERECATENEVNVIELHKDEDYLKNGEQGMLQKKKKKPSKKVIAERKILREEQYRKELVSPKSQSVKLIKPEFLHFFSECVGKSSARVQYNQSDLACDESVFPSLDTIMKPPQQRSSLEHMSVNTGTHHSTLVRISRDSQSTITDNDKNNLNLALEQKRNFIESKLKATEDLLEPKVSKKRTMHRGPILIDISKIIKDTKLKSKTKKQGMHSKESKQILSGNPLDASNPIRKRGKFREKKKIKVSPLKRLILQEREKRRHHHKLFSNQPHGLKSYQVTDSSISDGQNIFFNANRQQQDLTNVNTEKIIPTALTVSTDSKQYQDFSIKDNTNLSENIIDKELLNIRDMVVSSIPTTLNKELNVTPISTDIVHDFDIDGIVKSLKSMFSPKSQLHSRKFREYCEHMLTPEINGAAETLISELVRLQNRLYQRDPIKAQIKRRYVAGLRELKKHISLKKLKLLIIAPDIDRIECKGGLDDTVNQLKESASIQNIPYVFALNRNKLGHLLLKKTPVSCLGVLRYEACETMFNDLLNAVPPAREKYNLALSTFIENTTDEKKDKDEVVNPNIEENKALEDVTGNLITSFLSKLLDKNATTTTCSSQSVLLDEEDPQLHGRRVENHIGKTVSSAPEQDSNLDLLVLGSLVLHKTSVLANYTTDDKNEKRKGTRGGREGGDKGEQNRVSVSLSQLQKLNLMGEDDNYFLVNRGVGMEEMRGGAGALLNMLAEVASQKLHSDPIVASTVTDQSRDYCDAPTFNRARKISPRGKSLNGSINSKDLHSLSSNKLLKLFAEFDGNEMKRTFTYTCSIEPEHCRQSYSSFGSESKARQQMKGHLQTHVQQFGKNNAVQVKCSPVDAQKRRTIQKVEVSSKKRRNLRYSVKAEGSMKIEEADENDSRIPNVENIRSNLDKLAVHCPVDKLAVNCPALEKQSVATTVSCRLEEVKPEVDTSSIYNEHNYTNFTVGTGSLTERNLKCSNAVVSDFEFGGSIPVGRCEVVLGFEDIPEVDLEENMDDSAIDSEVINSNNEFHNDEVADIITARTGTVSTVKSNKGTEFLKEDNPAGKDVYSANITEHDVYIQKKKPKGKAKFIGQSKIEKEMAISLIESMKRRGNTSECLECHICSPPRSFTAPTTLISHYRSHAGIKPYECRICGSVFTRQHSLNYHMLIHSNQTRFTCADCGRKFRHPSHFKEHRRRHTGESPYECSDCMLRFKTRNTYKRHLKTRHGKVLTTAGCLIVLSDDEFRQVRTCPRTPNIIRSQKSAKKKARKSKKIHKPNTVGSLRNCNENGIQVGFNNIEVAKLHENLTNIPITVEMEDSELTKVMLEKAVRQNDIVEEAMRQSDILFLENDIQNNNKVKVEQVWTENDPNTPDANMTNTWDTVNVNFENLNINNSLEDQSSDLKKASQESRTGSPVETIVSDISASSEEDCEFFVAPAMAGVQNVTAVVSTDWNAFLHQVNSTKSYISLQSQGDFLNEAPPKQMSFIASNPKQAATLLMEDNFLQNSICPNA